MSKLKIKDITINLDNIRKPLNGIDREKISIKKLYPYCGANNIMDYVDEYLFDEEILCIAEDGGKWGKNEKCSYIMNEKCWINNHAHVLKVNDNVDIRYLKYWFNYNDLNSIITGAIVRKLTQKALNNIEINLPTKEEQIKIADKVDKIENLIQLKRTQIENLNELVKSQFVELFGDINLNDKVWNKDVLKNHLKVIGGYAFKSSEFQNTGIPVLRIGNINAGYFRPKDLMFYNEDEKLKNYIIYPNDVVMSLTGTVGKDDYGNVCIMGDDFEKYYLNQRNAKLELKETLNKMYISYALRVPEIKKRLTGISRGVRQANISNKDIENLEIPIPPIEFQNQFAEFVKLIDKQKFVIVEIIMFYDIILRSILNNIMG